MMPPTADAGLHHICREVLGSPVECRHVGGLRDNPAECRKARPEYIGDEHHIVLLADRATNLGGLAEVGGCTNQFGVCVAHLITTQPTTTELVDERASREPMIDHSATPIGRPTERSSPETHAPECTKERESMDAPE